MATITRSNSNSFTLLVEALKSMEGKVGRAGWINGAVYDNGMKVAHVAAINEFGATIQHPGGTPYGPNGFVPKSEGEGLPVTGPHEIVIPPRPFMRPTIDKQRDNWFRALEDGSKKILRGKATATQVLGTVAQKAADDVAETISQIQTPPLAKSTVAARKSKRADKKTVGNLTKPLVDTGILINSISGKVDNA